MLSLALGLGLTRGGSSSLSARLFAQRLADFDVASLSALTDGASISSWSSRVGGYTATQTGTNRPTYSATGWATDSGPAVAAAAASKQALACDALASIAASGASWGGAWLVRRSGSGEQILVGFSAGSATPYGYFALQISTGAARYANPAGTFNGSGTHVTYSDSDSLVACSVTGTTLTYWIDGYKGSFSISANNSSFTTAMLLSLPWSGTGGIHPSCFDGRIRRAVLYGRALADRDYAAIETQIGARYTRRVRPVIWGDSRTLSSSWPGTAFFGLPKYAHDITNNSEAGWHTYGVTGHTCVDVLADLTSNGIAAAYIAGKPCVHFVACGVNDPWVDGVDGATAHTRYKAIFDSLASTNPSDYRVAFTVPQRNDTGTYPVPQVTQAINDLNALIRANWQSYAHTLVDVVASSSKWLDPSSDYYDGGGVHFSTAGKVAFAGAVPVSAILAAAQARSSSIWLAS